MTKGTQRLKNQDMLQEKRTAFSIVFDGGIGSCGRGERNAASKQSSRKIDSLVCPTTRWEEKVVYPR